MKKVVGKWKTPRISIFRIYSLYLHSKQDSRHKRTHTTKWPH